MQQELAKRDQDDNGVLDFEEFLVLYRRTLSSARVRAKYADRMTLRMKKGKVTMSMLKRTVSQAGEITEVEEELGRQPTPGRQPRPTPQRRPPAGSAPPGPGPC